MKTFVIDAWIVGEKVTLLHRPSTQKTVDQWMIDNEKRLSDKGFSGFDVFSYEED